MKKIGLIIGESADVPKEIIEKYQMVVVPYVVDWRDGDTIEGKNIYQKMRKAEEKGIKTFPKTSQPSPWTFKKFFEEELERSQYIICITLSSGISGGYNSALQARGMLGKEQQERVYIVDSRNCTAGEGLFVMKAVELIEKSEDIEEIVKELKEFVPKVHLFGMLEDPKWVEAGGRMSHTLATLVRQMAKIGMRPLVGLKDGVVTSVALKMRAKDRPTALFREFEKETGEERKAGKKIRVVITHADNPEGAQKLKEMIEEEFKENIEIAFLNLISTVIGVHVGPGSLICSWCEA